MPCASSAENGVLTISGERKLEKEEQGKKFSTASNVRYGRLCAALSCLTTLIATR